MLLVLSLLSKWFCTKVSWCLFTTQIILIRSFPKFHHTKHKHWFSVCKFYLWLSPFTVIIHVTWHFDRHNYMYYYIMTLTFQCFGTLWPWHSHLFLHYDSNLNILFLPSYWWWKYDFKITVAAIKCCVAYVNIKVNITNLKVLAFPLYLWSLDFVCTGLPYELLINDLF